jgi:hypothetical protein
MRRLIEVNPSILFLRIARLDILYREAIDGAEIAPSMPVNIYWRVALANDLDQGVEVLNQIVEVHRRFERLGLLNLFDAIRQGVTYHHFWRTCASVSARLARRDFRVDFLFYFEGATDSGDNGIWLL